MKWHYSFSIKRASRYYEKLTGTFKSWLFILSNYITKTKHYISFLGKKIFNLLNRFSESQQRVLLNPFQSSVTFHIETGHLFFRPNEITDFYVKCNTRLKSVKKNEKWNAKLKMGNDTGGVFNMYLSKGFYTLNH